PAPDTHQHLKQETTTMTDQTTALAIPTGTALTSLFRTPDAADPIIARIRAEVMSHAPDLTTDKGRKAIASLAYKVSTSKTALDNAGKTLTDDAKKQIGIVDAARKKIRDELDALRDEVRKPLSEWEAAEDRRQAHIKATLEAFRDHGVTGEESSERIRERADDIKAITVDETFGEYLDQSVAAREATLTTLRGMYAAARKREDQEAELEKFRTEAAAREEADRVKREAAEAEQARIAAEKAEADRLARVAREREEAATRAAEEATRAAEAKADAARKASEEREAELKRQIEQAAQAERDRAEQERQASDDARKKREADTKHRAAIKADIVNALAAMSGRSTPDHIADALMAGEIPHCEVAL
nr:hypothetical protein [Allgaiera sp.]